MASFVNLKFLILESVCRFSKTGNPSLWGQGKGAGDKVILRKTRCLSCGIVQIGKDATNLCSSLHFTDEDTIKVWRFWCLGMAGGSVGYRMKPVVNATNLR